MIENKRIFSPEIVVKVFLYVVQPGREAEVGERRVRERVGEGGGGAEAGHERAYRKKRGKDWRPALLSRRSGLQPMIVYGKQ